MISGGVIRPRKIKGKEINDEEVGFSFGGPLWGELQVRPKGEKNRLKIWGKGIPR